jgi:tetratricopeptide (TPR) repeat protein
LANSIALVTILMFALCNAAFSEQLDQIDNTRLKEFSQRELAKGAPTLNITSRALYRQAIRLLELDNEEIAREKLLLASRLSGDYPDPLFTLARLELINGNPDFLFHFLGALSRSINNFQSSCQLAANLYLLLIASLVGTLFAILILLLWKYWTFINHWIEERYPAERTFPPVKWIGFISIVALLLLRPGLIIYISILTIVLWTFMNKKEKATVISLMILLAIGSAFSKKANTFIAVLDPGSVTSKLSLINKRGADSRLINSIAGIENPAFRAERDYALGTLMYRQCRINEAKQYFLDSVSERKDFAPAFINLGNVYFEQGDYDKAIAGYQNAIALDSMNVIAYYNIGQAYIKKMLFSKSSAALQKANNLGLDNFREIYSTIKIRDLTIYEGGLRKSDLWSIAQRESEIVNASLLDMVMRPFLLVPLKWVWLVLTTTLISAILIGKNVPKEWSIFRCNNCGRPTCHKCSEREEGILLCPDCSGVIEELTSIKVMEALLRHKRQKIIKIREKKSLPKKIIYPLGAYIFAGRVFAGSIIILVNISALLMLLWKGSYFVNFRTLPVTTPIWKYIVPPLIMGFSYFVASCVKLPGPLRNYRILPPDFRAEAKKKKEEQRKSINADSKPTKEVESILDEF